MGDFDEDVGERNQGATALVLDLAKAFERVSLPVVLAWATRFNFPWKILLRAPAVCTVSRMWERRPTITALLPGSRLSCLLLRIVMQDALSEVTKNLLPLKLTVSVDDITAFING